MGIQDNFWTLGDEAVAYGTRAATLTRGYENQADEVTPRVEFRTSRGMRPGGPALLASRSVAVSYGGSVSLTVDLLNKGMGLFFGGFASGDLSSAVTHPGTLAYLHTFTQTTTGPTRSSTIHAGRYDDSGSVHHVDHLGCIGDQLELSVEPGGNVKVKGTWDYKMEDTSASSVTPAWTSGAHVYTDQDTDISLDGSSKCAKAFSVTLPTGIDKDRKRICATGRAKPILTGQVVGTGSITLDYSDDTYYDAFLAGDDMPLVVTCTGPTIEDTTSYSVTLTIPSIQFSGSAPKAALDATPEQALPFNILWDGTNPTWKIEVVTTDSAL
jgi:hypothetical protein